MADTKMSQIAITVGAEPATKTVILVFSTKVDRVEFTPMQARMFAQTLVDRSFIADGTVKVPPTPTPQGPTILRDVTPKQPEDDDFHGAPV